ncbi:MAG: sigma 54-interacting transcriptional regulator [Planctomycetes bacterium]|nr:sigma 54-interacting transcriptional regulator [Planctomycetota bacterium]
MAVHVEVTDSLGFRAQTVDAEQFWIGCAPSCSVQVEIPNCRSRVVEVRAAADGSLHVRTEPGLGFPVRSVSGNVGARFEPCLDGDVLNVGPALVKLSRVQASIEGKAQELDLSRVRGPGTPVGTWYETFMGVADHLEAVRDPERGIAAAIDGILAATTADRIHVALDAEHAIAGRTAFFRTRDGGSTPFRISSGIVEKVREAGRVVHVPLASADPVASQFVSVRREGISAGIALPLSALGRAIGVLYADCVREGAVLTAEDLQRVVFIARLLAQSLGNRDLVAALVRTPTGGEAPIHQALATASPSCTEMIERVKLYAPTDYTVLLRGETGSGKEVLARAIHELSKRKDGPFVPVNCAAIPEQLMESMLFGHEKGAFTGASATRRGHFEEAHGGTLFLDEIGDMPLDLQAKILRALQDRVVTPIGSSRQVRVDVRILAATHQDLEKMVDERRFREDLYYRLRELEIALPPLRRRREDIPMLAHRFLEEAARELGFPQVPELTKHALELLEARPWRGNIRELRHVVKAAALRSGGSPLRPEHLDAAPLLARDRGAAGAEELDASATWKERLEAQEKAALQRTLEEASGNLTRAAKLFGVPRTTYRERLVKHGLLKEGEE